jgi:hypothetical protein
MQVALLKRPLTDDMDHEGRAKAVQLLSTVCMSTVQDFGHHTAWLAAAVDHASATMHCIQQVLLAFTAVNAHVQRITSCFLAMDFHANPTDNNNCLSVFIVSSTLLLPVLLSAFCIPISSVLLLTGCLWCTRGAACWRCWSHCRLPCCQAQRLVSLAVLLQVCTLAHLMYF